MIRKPPLIEAQNAVGKQKKYGQKRISKWRNGGRSPSWILDEWVVTNAQNQIRAHQDHSWPFSVRLLQSLGYVWYTSWIFVY